MNDKTGTYKTELMLAQCGINGCAFEYYKCAARIASEDPESLNQIIMYIYYPMSVHFCQTISFIERTMRESAAQLYFGAPELFDQKRNDHIGVVPTVSEVLGVLIDFEYSDNY